MVTNNEFAIIRTKFTNQRTYLAYLRTGQLFLVLKQYLRNYIFFDYLWFYLAHINMDT